MPDGSTYPGDVFLDDCRNDPNVFVEYVLDVDQCPVHERIQDWYTAQDSCYVEEHRGIGKTVQTICRCAFEIGRTAMHHEGLLPDELPTDRIKYVQVNNDEAARSVDMCRQIIESPRYRQVFPEVRPSADGPWGSLAFKIDTPHVQRDPTMHGVGIFGHTGGRAELLVLDDVCDLENAIRKPALRQQVKDAYLNTWLPMLTGSRRRTWRISTCWHVDDVTAMWREECGDAGTLMRHPVVDFRSLAFCDDIQWSHQFAPSLLQLEREKLGPIAYARAYELSPVSAEQIIFEEAWLERGYVTEVPTAHVPGGRAVAMFDFAFTEKSQKGDPDYSVCLVGWIHPTGHAYATDMLKVRATYPDFKRAAIAKCEAAGVREAFGEGNGPQAGLVQQMNLDAPFPVSRLTRSTDKITRATLQQSFVETGRLHVLCNRESAGGLRPVPGLRSLVDEMVSFPASGHDDCVDAVVDLCDIAQRRQRVGGTITSHVDGRPVRPKYGQRGAADRMRDRLLRG